MLTTPTIVIVSGYFNPLHIGHIELFSEAKKLGDKLYVILNNDTQVKLKGSIEFMSEDERKILLGAIRYIDYVKLSIDDDRTVCKTLEALHKSNASGANIIFANGGDRKNSEIPEKEICDKLGINIVDNVGGNKIQSSSTLLNNIK